MNHDSAPIVAYFRDRDSAEQCLRELRNSGILNEQIGVSYADSTVVSPANYVGVGRATDQANSTSEIEDYVHTDAGTEGFPGQPTPNTDQFDSEWEAKEYQHPLQGMVISVSVEPQRREEVRGVLHHYGARLSDWPAQAA